MRHLLATILLVLLASAAAAKQPPAKTDNSIQGLKNQRTQIQKNIKKQEQALQKNKSDVKTKLRNLMLINTRIDSQKQRIDSIENEVKNLDGNIRLLQTQIETLDKQLEDRKDKYAKSLRYMTRHHSFEDKLMFIFSAHSFGEALRRLRFVKEYASFQRAQGELLKTKQDQLAAKRAQLETAKQQMAGLLAQLTKERDGLEGQYAEQQTVVKTLQKQQKSIQNVISDQKKKDAALNAQIEKLIAEEVARQQEIARKKAEAEAEAKRKAEELARKKAEAEALERENQRRIEAAKAEEKRLKDAAAKANEQEKARAEQKAREAEANRIAAEKKASADTQRSNKAVAKAEEASAGAMYTSVDQKLSSNFESNKGRLPIPITGTYRIVSHFGQYNVEGLNGVTLDNKGINILGTSGCEARSIFDGEVSAVANIGGTWLVLVRHGRYISVYCNLRQVSVKKGQKVAARQSLGRVAADNILQFQLRKETAKLNPEAWLGR
ncbi:MAG: peptidoglycan DD-metalloendopeptidase family protein [Prevotella sp.]|nr:peptidoglycan DD-metalloendopeptidase family protein [Prevotella sp.]MCD8305058.1 peptidoglycan DD-metalloendopeptidase family protein [Prevotella sp.]